MILHVQSSFKVWNLKSLLFEVTVSYFYKEKSHCSGGPVQFSSKSVPKRCLQMEKTKASGVSGMLRCYFMVSKANLVSAEANLF